jgi:hypothetical protein
VDILTLYYIILKKKISKSSAVTKLLPKVGPPDKRPARNTMFYFVTFSLTTNFLLFYKDTHFSATLTLSRFIRFPDAI